MKCVIAVFLAVTLSVSAQSTFAPSAGVPSPQVAWRITLPTPGDRYGDPIVHDGVLYQAVINAGGMNSTLYAIDTQSGAIQWSAVHKDHGRYLAAGDGMIYFGTETSVVAYSVTQSTSAPTPAWTYRDNLRADTNLTRWPAKPTFVRREGIVLCTWYNTPLVALDAKTGAVKFTTLNIVRGRIWLVNETTVYFNEAIPSADGKHHYRLTKASTKDASVYWSSASLGTSWTTTAASRYGVASKIPASNTAKFALQGFNVETGEAAWTAPSNSYANFDYNVGVNSVLQAAFDGNSQYHLNAFNPTTGALRWSTAVSTTDTSTNCFASEDSTVVVLQGENSGVITAIDALQGWFLWQMRINTAPASGYGVTDEQKYYFGADGGRTLYAVFLRS